MPSAYLDEQLAKAQNMGPTAPTNTGSNMAASLFQGAPNKATSYVTSTTETPKWMQDAIYNQIQWSTNLAQRPYEGYAGSLVAGADPLQSQAYDATKQNAGAWNPAYQQSLSGMQAMAGKSASDLVGGDYLAPQTYQKAAKGNYNPISNQREAFGGFGNSYLSPQAGEQAFGGEYLAPATGQQTLGGNYFSPDAGQKTFGGNYLSPASQQQAFGGNYLSPETNQKAFGGNYLAPETQQDAYQQVGNYMNPYNAAVTDRIAQLGARNLNEVLLPGVSDSFVRAGQFGSSRMGEFGARALRDTQDSILGQQSQALQQGYGQSLSAAQSDLARKQAGYGQGLSAAQADMARQQAGYGQGLTAAQADLARQQQGYTQGMSTAQADLARQQQGFYQGAGLSQADLARQQQGYGQGLTAAQADLSRQQQGYGQALSAAEAALARQQSGLYQGMNAEQADLNRQQSGFYQGLNAAQSDLARQQQATGTLSDLARAGQSMRSADVASLDAAGQGMQSLAQRQADSAYNQFLQQRDYPKTTLDWLSTQVRGMAPITPSVQTNQSSSTGQTYSPSPLSQIASGMAIGKGLLS
jgi:hypothetical protein